MKSKTGFTLIELLIVIGILAVLVVTILITLNPSEAQKKARDTKRMKDAAVLSAIILQYLNDGNYPTNCLRTSGGCSSFVGGIGQTQSCNDNWLQENFCNYTKTVPLDPGASRTCVNGGTVASPTMGSCNARYWAIISGSDYEINVKQESKSSAGNVLNDGGDQLKWAEVGSNLNLFNSTLDYD